MPASGVEECIAEKSVGWSLLPSQIPSHVSQFGHGQVDPGCPFLLFDLVIAHYQEIISKLVTTLVAQSMIHSWLLGLNYRLSFRSLHTEDGS